jgi:response regulator RpfG family c-di-GMP phosphodiesterase
LALPRILCVDDEPQIVEGLTRVLRKKFEVVTASGGEAALARLDRGESFEVIVSDMRMPGMNGATLLAKFNERAPNVTRVLLTGHAEIDAAIAAVNEGHVFRFLTKPCPPEVLIPALEAAVAQYRLITAERVLLEETLLGSVRALTEALDLSRPEALRGTFRRHERARAIALHLKVPDAWHVEVASMISCVGYVILPSEIVTKLQAGAPLDLGEREMAARLPGVAERVLSHIPRLEKVQEVLKHFGPADPPPKDRRANEVPIGSKILGIVRDLSAAEAREGDTLRALAALKANAASYDPAVLAAVLEVCEPRPPEVRSIGLKDLATGMVLASDVVARSGLLLVARGQRVSLPLLERLRNFNVRIGVVEPILCEVSRDAG